MIAYKMYKKLFAAGSPHIHKIELCTICKVGFRKQS